LQGKLFDIKSIEHKNGMTSFHGLYDDEETSLTNNFNKGWNKDLSDQSQLMAQFFQCLQGIYFNPPPDILVLSKKQQHLVALSSPKLQNLFKTILTPPPQA
jgi:hypothetical protein